MNRRLVGVVLALSTLLLACFARLAADPSALIVDGDHPSLDHARPRDDPSVGNDLTRLLPAPSPGHRPIDREARPSPALGRSRFRREAAGRQPAGRPVLPACLAGLVDGGPIGPRLDHHRTSALGRTWDVSTRPDAPHGRMGELDGCGCFQASPYVLAQAFEGHYPHVWAACWYPWAFDAAIKLRRGDGRSALNLAPLLAATFLAGHPQEGYYLLIALGAWTAIDGLASIRVGKGWQALGLWTTWAGILLLAIGLMGIELVPDAMAQGWGLRGARLPLRVAGRYHVYPINLLQLLGPRALGGPAEYFGHENYWESVTSIGLIPLALAMIGVAWSPDRRTVGVG